MTTIREYVFTNISGAFFSIRSGDAFQGLAPGAMRPVSVFFRLSNGEADVEAAKANESVKSLMDQGLLTMTEREYTPKSPSTAGKLYNETDPEEMRVAKILASRRKLKEEIARKAAPAPAPKKGPKE